MLKATILSAILMMALLAASVAAAKTSDDSDRETARVAAKRASAAYNLGQFEEAAALYEEAYRLVPDPILLYNLGQSYRQASKLDKALITYRSYLRTAPEDAPNRVKVQQWVDELEWTSDIQSKVAAQRAAQTQKTEPPPPVVPAPAIPTPSEPQLLREHVSPPSAPATSALVSAPRKTQAQASASWKKWAPWVGLGITAILGAATIAEGLSARSSFEDLRGDCGKTKTCTDSQVDALRSKATVTNVLLGLTTVSAAATGIAFYLRYSGATESGVSLAWKY